MIEDFIEEYSEENKAKLLKCLPMLKENQLQLIEMRFFEKRSFKEIGEIADEGKLELIKAEWAMNAIEYGCKFRAIVGSKMC